LPISSVLTTKERRITKTCFRTRSTCKSHYQASLCLYTTSLDFHPRLANLCTPPLRYGWRSPQPNCPPNTVSTISGLGFPIRKRGVSLMPLQAPSYARQSKSSLQCQVTVKLPGSFCPSATRPRLHSHLNFARSILETVVSSLCLSCASELTRQGTSLNKSITQLISRCYPFGVFAHLNTLHVAMKFRLYLVPICSLGFVRVVVEDSPVLHRSLSC